MNWELLLLCKFFQRSGELFKDKNVDVTTITLLMSGDLTGLCLYMNSPNKLLGLVFKMIFCFRSTVEVRMRQVSNRRPLQELVLTFQGDQDCNAQIKINKSVLLGTQIVVFENKKHCFKD